MSRQIMVLVAMTALLFGCNSGFKDQNPLSGQPDSVKRAIPPEKKTDSPAADVLPEDSLQVDADNFYEFVEGEEKEIKIGSRVLLPDADYYLELEGADRRLDSVVVTPSADKHELTVKWTPPQGWVGDQSVRRTRVTAVLAAKRGKSMLSRRQEIEMVVFRADVGPEIVQVGEMPPAGVREGESFEFEVRVKDPESVSTLQPLTGKAPVLRVVETNNSSSLSSFVEIQDSPRRDEKDPTIWIFKVKINLAAEFGLTRNQDAYHFGLQAINRHLVPSMSTKQVVQVRTTLVDPMTSWMAEQSVIFAENRENYFAFRVFDPRFEGQVSVEWVTDWKKYPGLLVTCSVTESTMQNCQIAWTPKSNPQFTLPKIIELEFKVVSKTTVDKDEYSKDVTFKRRLLVQKIGQPPIENELGELVGGGHDATRTRADNTVYVGGGH